MVAYNGDVLWPARLPDLNALDFYPYGHKKRGLFI